TDRDPALAQELANAVSAALVDQIRNFEPRPTKAATDQVISVYDQAQQPGAPNPSGMTRNLVLAGLFGVIVAAGVLALLEYLDITLHSVESAERALGLPVLGVVPQLGDRLPISPAVAVTRERGVDERPKRRGASVG